MGRHHQDGYSADVEGFLVVDGQRFPLAKTNGQTFYLAESCELAPGTQGELLIIIDGNSRSKLVSLPGGISVGQTVVSYTVMAPF